jgi:WD40 repeat protein
VVDLESGETVQTLPTDFGPGWTSWSPDGTQMAAADQNALVLLDVATGDQVWRTEAVGRVGRPEWLPEGDAFGVGGELNPRVIDAATGEIRLELRGIGATGTFDYDVVPGTALLAAAAFALGDFTRGGDTVLFDTSQLGGLEVAGWATPIETWRTSFTGDGNRVYVSDGASYLTADTLDGSNAHFVQGESKGWWPDSNALGTFAPSLDPDGNWSVRATATDEVVYEAPSGWSIHGVSWDGAQVVINEGEGDDCGPSRVVSTLDGSVTAELHDSKCVGRALFSPDGALVYVFYWVQPFGVFDTQTGELLVDFTDTEYAGLAAAFSPDSSTLVVGTGRLYVLDVPILLSGAPIEEAIKRELPAHEALVLRITVSPDNSMAATASWDEPLKVWNLQTGELLGEFGGTVQGQLHDGGFHPTQPWLLVSTPSNEVRIYTLDPDELVALAEDRLSRDMTEEECQQYFREPCPGS